MILFPMGLNKAQSYAASLFVIATILWITEVIPRTSQLIGAVPGSDSACSYNEKTTRELYEDYRIKENG